MGNISLSIEVSSRSISVCSMNGFMANLELKTLECLVVEVSVTQDVVNRGTLSQKTASFKRIYKTRRAL